MKNKETYNKWINAAYKEFAECGPDFSLKALSDKTDLPRTTFYYHFLSKDDLIVELLKFHRTINDMFQDELGKLEHLIPDLYEKLYPYQISLKFQQQLLRHSHIRSFSELYKSVNCTSIKSLLPHIKAYFCFDCSDDEVFKFYITLTDNWYARLDFSCFSVKSMTELAEEIMENVISITHHSIPKSV